MYYLYIDECGYVDQQKIEKKKQSLFVLGSELALFP